MITDNLDAKRKYQVTFGLAMVAGLGLTLMIVALGIGVIQGEGASSDAIGMTFFIGVALLILGSIGWYGVTQPQKHFDDINIPMEAEPHHHDDHHETGDEAHNAELATIESH